MEEKSLWTGRPSQWMNFTTFFWCLLTCWLVIPIFIALWKYLTVKFWKIEITNQRVIEHRGVLSKTIDELELYRVKDIELHQPFFLRLVGLSHIYLTTSDKTHSLIKIPAIRNGDDLRKQLREAVEIRRDQKGVRELDL